MRSERSFPNRVSGKLVLDRRRSFAYACQRPSVLEAGIEPARCCDRWLTTTNLPTGWAWLRLTPADGGTMVRKLRAGHIGPAAVQGDWS